MSGIGGSDASARSVLQASPEACGGPERARMTYRGFDLADVPQCTFCGNEGGDPDGECDACTRDGEPRRPGSYSCGGCGRDLHEDQVPPVVERVDGRVYVSCVECFFTCPRCGHQTAMHGPFGCTAKVTREGGVCACTLSQFKAESEHIHHHTPKDRAAHSRARLPAPHGRVREAITR